MGWLAYGRYYPAKQVQAELVECVLTPERAERFAAMAQYWADRPGYDFRPDEQAKCNQQAADWQAMADHFQHYAKAARGEKPS